MYKKIGDPYFVPSTEDMLSATWTKLFSEVQHVDSVINPSAELKSSIDQNPIVSDPKYRIDSTFIRSLVRDSKKFEEKVGVVHEYMGGWWAIAIDTIPMSSRIIYAGQISTNPGHVSVYAMPITGEGNSFAVIDAAHYGNIARFFCHLPSADCINSMEDPLTQNLPKVESVEEDETTGLVYNVAKNRLFEIVTANLDWSIINVDGICWNILTANRDIHIGELIGYDYGLQYWLDLRTQPILFQKSTTLKNIIPVSRTQYTVPLFIVISFYNNEITLSLEKRLAEVLAQKINFSLNEIEVFFPKSILETLFEQLLIDIFRVTSIDMVTSLVSMYNGNMQFNILKKILEKNTLEEIRIELQLSDKLSIPELLAKISDELQLSELLPKSENLLEEIKIELKLPKELLQEELLASINALLWLPEELPNHELRNHELTKVLLIKSYCIIGKIEFLWKKLFKVLGQVSLVEKLFLQLSDELSMELGSFAVNPGTSMARVAQLSKRLLDELLAKIRLTNSQGAQITTKNCLHGGFVPGIFMYYSSSSDRAQKPLPVDDANGPVRKAYNDGTLTLDELDVRLSRSAILLTHKIA